MDKEQVNKMHAICVALFKEADRVKAIMEPIVKLVLPELVSTSYLQDNENEDGQDSICARARQDCFKLTGAFASYIFPVGRRFFRYGSWNVDSTDKDMSTEGAYVKISDIIHANLERSNFHRALYSTNLDKVAWGTGCELAEMHPKGQLFLFTHVPFGTFGFAENAQHEVDKVVRKFKYTAEQIADKFGEDKMNAQMLDAYRNETRRYTQEFEIWHLTMPNPNKNGFEFISLYLSADDKTVLLESGYEQFPYMVTRFRKYGNQVYGHSPLLTIKDTIRNNIIGKQCRRLRDQRATLPSIMAPADIIGEIDLRPAGKTILPDQYLGRPDVIRELAPAGNYQMSVDSEAKDEAEIDMALHIDFLQVISGQDRYMTATEVQQRASEKIMTLTETFMLAQEDMRVMFNRLFALAINNGLVARRDLPPDLVSSVPGENGVDTEKVNMPKMVFIGLMAQMMERVQTTAFWDWVARAKQMAIETQDPRWMSCLDVRIATRQEAINLGVESKYLLSWDEESQKLAELEQAQMAQQQAAAEAQQAAAARDSAQAQNLLTPQ